MATGSTDIVACPDCDLLQRVPSVRAGETARCPRCGRALATGKTDPFDRTLALALAALVALVLANTEILMELSARGRESSTTILGGAREMWRQGERVSAVLVCFFTTAAPAAYIGCMIALLLAVRRPPAPRWAGTVLRWAETGNLWSMVEVMMLGILVSLVKIASLADVRPGIGFFAVGPLVFLLAAMSTSFDPREAWSRVRWENGYWPGSDR
ncbi:MAG: paraquat-inducible protein A [Thermodesulfobacteriota bacterium]